VAHGLPSKNGEGAPLTLPLEELGGGRLGRFPQVEGNCSTGNARGADYPSADDGGISVAVISGPAFPLPAVEYAAHDEAYTTPTDDMSAMFAAQWPCPA
jgi:hypothetical protein